MQFQNYDARVDLAIDSLAGWQRALCTRLRQLIHEAEPNIEETIKFTNRPYFTLRGNVCALLGTKDHVNVFIYDPIAPDPNKIINQGHDNTTARAIQIYEHDTLNERAFISLIRAVCANNRAGGWRKLQASK